MRSTAIEFAPYEHSCTFPCLCQLTGPVAGVEGTQGVGHGRPVVGIVSTKDGEGGGEAPPIVVEPGDGAGGGQDARNARGTLAGLTRGKL